MTTDEYRALVEAGPAVVMVAKAIFPGRNAGASLKHFV